MTVMFERFDEGSRQVWTLAGEIAARRTRRRRRMRDTLVVDGVTIQLADLRVALALLRPKAGWTGRSDRHVDRRLESLPKRGPITAEHLEEAIR